MATLSTAEEIRAKLEAENDDPRRELLKRSLAVLEELEDAVGLPEPGRDLVRDLRAELGVSQASLKFRPSLSSDLYGDVLVTSCDGHKYRIVFDVEAEAWPGEIRMYRLNPNRPGDDEQEPFSTLVLSTEEVSE